MQTEREFNESGSSPLAILFSLGVGAALMYFLDPDNGRRRRALVRDQLVRGGHSLQDASEAAVRAAANRTRGAIKRTQQRITGEDAVEDSILEERVRSALGHIIDDLNSFTVRATSGNVVLEGAAKDIESIVECTQHVRGVRDVDTRLSAG